MADPITKYATRVDLTLYALPARLLEGIEPDTIEAALEAQSRKADKFLGAQYTLPLTAVSVDVTEAVAWMAAYTLMTTEGFSPEMGQDNEFRARYDRAIKYLEGIESGDGFQPGLAGSESTGPSGGGQAIGARPLGVSSSSRGYSSRSSDSIPRVVFDQGRPSGGFVGD